MPIPQVGVHLLTAIDPGPLVSAFVDYDVQTARPVQVGMLSNESMLHRITVNPRSVELVVIERIASYGMAVGEEVFETVFWTGRFYDRAYRIGLDAERIPRQKVKLHLCKSSTAKDANVRQALLDRFGPGVQRAIGTSKHPGPLFGVREDIWAALAVAVVWADTQLGIPFHP